MKITRFHHAQISVPTDAVEEAHAFYCGLMQLEEIEKPDTVKKNGGFWVLLGDVEVHIAIEDGVDRCKTKTHLAYQVDNVQAWETTLHERGIHMENSIPLPGYDRIQFRDPFGNRVEFIQSL